MPVTAPTANSTAAAFDQRFGQVERDLIVVLRPRYSATSIISGSATPTQARMMWNPSVNAIRFRAASRLSATGSGGARLEIALTDRSLAAA